MLVGLRRQTGRRVAFPDSGKLESSRSEAVVVVVSVESVIVTRRSMVDLTLPDKRQLSSVMEMGF